MGNPNSFILKLLSIDTLATSSVPGCGITTLHHEALDDSMELHTLIVAWFTFLSCANGTEVLSCLWYILIKYFENNSALLEAFTTLFANCDIKVCLYTFLLESWDGIDFCWSSLFLIVDTFLEELCKSILFLSCGFRLSFLTNSVMGA